VTLKLEAGSIVSSFSLPASKSHANRYLILAARRGTQSWVRGLPKSDDVVFLLNALKAIGLEISGEGDVCFTNSFPACEKESSPLTLEVGEGGTTARFLAALLAAGKRPYILRMGGRLADRPWEELTDALKLAGAAISWHGSELTLQGPIDVTKLPQTISAARSTQFASALLLAFAQEGYQVCPVEMTTSKPYWDMTLECIQQAQRGEMVVPQDWSSAAYPLCFVAAKGGEITLPGLQPDTQADRALYEFLHERGAASFDGKAVKGKKLSERGPLNFSAHQCPDLIPALAFLAAHLEGESRIVGVAALRHKESDRLAAILSLLKQCGVDASHDDKGDALLIRGGVKSPNSALSVPADHRLVMTAALFLRAQNGGRLPYPEAVRKSFPNFFDLF
jgi:3-phosphoshikimate 1-carboxyvinyltransferase